MTEEDRSRSAGDPNAPMDAAPELFSVDGRSEPAGPATSPEVCDR